MSDRVLDHIAFGEFVELRGRKWLSQGAEQLANELNVVRISCIEDDAQGEEALVIWDAEVAAHTATDSLWNAIGSEGADTAATFSAWLKTVDWNSTSVADKDLFQAPFRAGIRLDPYQLAPLQKALALPRVNMLIADDVGLGKTIEAALVLREMLLRGRVNFVVIACPPSMIMQWHEELSQKFGITATVLDRNYLAQIRRRRGFGTNPWASGSCFLVSHRLLTDETYASGLREILGPMRSNSMLILDEAHHAAPASGSRYAIDSQFTRAVRDIAQGFEHRLFLSATPHNGHSNSFTALLEILDPHRFTRGVPVETADLEPVMVRRLKSDLRALGEHFPERVVEEIRLEGLEIDTYDLQLSEMLETYGAMRDARLHAMTARERAEGKLVFSGLQQRLLSSPEAFKKTLEVHLRAMKAPTSTERSPLTSLAKAFADGKEVDGMDEDDLNYSVSTIDDADDDPSLVIAATRAGLNGASEPVVADEKAFVKLMLEEARKASLKPDARVRWIACWVRQNMVQDGQWNDRRLIIFTEYQDTRLWLENRLMELLDDLDPEAHFSSLTGMTSLEDRERIKFAFNCNPAENPLRLLICTDAAREGINLQKGCYDLIHFDLPWNPSRLEQRNGRIDRKLQPAPTVYCRYFRYTQRPTDIVQAALVRKTEKIRNELGAVGRVIEDRLMKRLTSEGIRRERAVALAAELESDDDTAVYRAEIQALNGSDEKRRKAVADHNARLRKTLEDSRRRVGVLGSDLQQVFEIALSQSGGNLSRSIVSEVPDANVFSIQESDPLFSGAGWTKILDDLRIAPPAKGQKLNEWRASQPLKRLSFDPVVLPDQRDAPEVCHLHVEHRFVRRLVARFVSQGFRARLNRACVLGVPNAQRRAVLLGRMSLYGPKGVRLHEEIIPTTGRIGADGQLRILRQGLDAEAMTLARLEDALREGKAASDAVSVEALKRRQGDIEDLRAEFEQRSAPLIGEVTGQLQELGRKEEESMRRLLLDQRNRLQKRARDPEQGEFNFEEQRQVDADRRHWQKKLDRLTQEIEVEPAKVRKGYEVIACRLEPVGLIYLWPETA
ncbi:DISARM system SNF2-like helicase DrmD [Roseovarius sp. EGI FJ00037]|uniref:DISARM system SNF2-like helicase DrmD n=1 Tax=Roseovarius salincola TaxID=2978479 RepID=UPI0022A68205|nr:DISARM system SNF2-like helicase DrmD [Roseovarius sp. EGI FJ00037]MCZ0810604.1 DISARM system SNF2-like helicase DrmD [Roseovarius sp. EGI FJ00037]